MVILTMNYNSLQKLSINQLKEIVKKLTKENKNIELNNLKKILQIINLEN